MFHSGNEKILVDICNTIADINSELQKRGVETNTYPAKTDLTLPDWLKTFMYAEPYPGAAELLNSIYRNGLEIVYFTARPAQADFVTLRWLDMHGFPPGNLLMGLERKNKIKCVEVYQPYFVMEDDPYIIRELLKLNFPVIAKKQPYNFKLGASEKSLLYMVEDYRVLCAGQTGTTEQKGGS